MLVFGVLYSVGVCVCDMLIFLQGIGLKEPNRCRVRAQVGISLLYNMGGENDLRVNPLTRGAQRNESFPCSCTGGNCLFAQYGERVRLTSGVRSGPPAAAAGQARARLQGFA